MKIISDGTMVGTKIMCGNEMCGVVQNATLYIDAEETLPKATLSFIPTEIDIVANAKIFKYKYKYNENCKSYLDDGKPPQEIKVRIVSENISENVPDNLKDKLCVRTAGIRITNVDTEEILGCVSSISFSVNVIDAYPEVIIHQYELSTLVEKKED